MSFDYRASKIVRAKGPCLDGQAILAAPAADQDLLVGALAGSVGGQLEPRGESLDGDTRFCRRDAGDTDKPARERDSISSSVGSATPNSAARLSIHSRVEGIFIERTMTLVTSRREGASRP
jgi:hypothetical protein